MLGVQGARSRRVDRLMAVIPLDPVPWRILAQYLAHRASAPSSLSRLALCGDPISSPKYHCSSFGLTSPERTATGRGTNARGLLDIGTRHRPLWEIRSKALARGDLTCSRGRPD